MALLKAFADVLQEYRDAKKSGALFVSVAAASENLVRFYLKDGEVCYVSFGPLKDRECYDVLDCYDFGKAVYFDGMKPPAISADLPKTEEMIEKFRKLGKQVQLG